MAVMDPVALVVWGAYFGSVGLMLLGALAAYGRSAQRVALTGALSAGISAVYVLLFLGWLPLPIPRDTLLRVQSFFAIVAAVVLSTLLFWTLGQLRTRRQVLARGGTMAAAGLLALLAGALAPPEGALVAAGLMQAVAIVAAVLSSVRSALRGDRLGWLAVTGVSFMSVLVLGMTRHALAPQATSAAEHVVVALCSMAFVSSMAVGLWWRYSYLIGVREIMNYGPAFDPITRMRSHVETDAMVTEAFARSRREGYPVGVLVVSIGNLSSLEQLHGRAAYNHGLFVCAGRLRRVAPPGAELGRLNDDAFLLVLRRPTGLDPLMGLGREVVQRLGRPVALGTSQDISELEASRTHWVADLGVGVFIARPSMRPGAAVAGARAMSRTAWSYASRVAWYDEEARQITELPPSSRP